MTTEKFNMKKSKSVLANVLLLYLVLFLLNIAPAYSLDPQSAAFSINAETKDINTLTDVQKINEMLDDLEKKWNEHDIKGIVKNYSDDFINGDGINLEAVKNLTSDLWEAYPDIMTKTQERTVRMHGEYATVESTDVYEGTSSMVRQEVNSKGVLKAIAGGELFLKKFGPTLKITSDKTLLEKVSIGYGIGQELINQNKIRLSSPEQVAAGQVYTARLDFDLPDDIKPVSAISKEILIYPQVTAEDKFRLTNESKLERLLSANKISKNELITATVGLTGGALKTKLLGLIFLTRRVNVIPVTGESSEVSIIKEPARSVLNKEIEPLDTYPNEHKIQPEKKKEENKEQFNLDFEE